MSSSEAYIDVPAPQTDIHQELPSERNLTVVPPVAGETERTTLASVAILDSYRAEQGSREEALQERLGQRAKAGDEAALEQFCRSILPLVYDVSFKLNVDDVELDDRRQIAFERTVKAVMEFDPNRGMSLLSYVIGAIQRQLLDERRKILARKGVGKLAWAELRAAINGSSNPNAEVHAFMTAGRIAPCVDIAVDPVDNTVLIGPLLRLNASTKTEGNGQSETEIVEAISLDTEETVHDMTARKLENEQLDRIMQEVLTEREQLVLRHRFELHGAQYYKFLALGNMLGVSESRANQIEREALQKLKTRLGKAQSTL